MSDDDYIVPAHHVTPVRPIRGHEPEIEVIVMDEEEEQTSPEYEVARETIPKPIMRDQECQIERL